MHFLLTHSNKFKEQVALENILHSSSFSSEPSPQSLSLSQTQDDGIHRPVLLQWKSLVEQFLLTVKKN